MNNYETVFILNPVLSEDQIKETVQKYEKFLTSKGAKIVSKEDWGLKKLAYPIQNKKSGFYHLFQYSVDPNVIWMPILLLNRIRKSNFLENAKNVKGSIMDLILLL